MNNKLTELAIILDRSGSMSGKEQDVIGGYNQLISDRKKEMEDTLVSLVLFDDRYELLYDRKNVREIGDLTKEEYYVRGCTALYDAIGITIDKIGERLAETPEEERPHRVIFAIMTDGYENASRRYSHQAIKALVKQQQEIYSWEFLFLGANIDSEDTAIKLGMDKDMAFDFEANSEGIEKSFSYMSRCIREENFRTNAYNYKVDILDLDLNNKSYDLLQKNGIHKVIDLARNSSEKLKKIGLSQKDVEEIVNKLDGLGISLTKDRQKEKI